MEDRYVVACSSMLQPTKRTYQFSNCYHFGALFFIGHNTHKTQCSRHKHRMALHCIFCVQNVFNHHLLRNGINTHTNLCVLWPLGAGTHIASLQRVLYVIALFFCYVRVSHLSMQPLYGSKTSSSG